MLKGVPNFKIGQIEKFYNRISKAEKKDLEDYLKERVATGLRSENKIKDIRRELLQLRYVLQLPFSKLTYKKLVLLVGKINTSHFSDYYKNDIKVNLKSYLKWKFPKTWAIKFKELTVLKQRVKDAERKRKIDPATELDKEDIEKLMQHENSNFWKAYLMTQYEGGLRTGETRNLKHDDVKMTDEEIVELSIYSPKTGKPRASFVKEAKFYLKKLKEEQDNLGIVSEYLFPSEYDPSKPITTNTVSRWFRSLTKKALGTERWAYLLRHARGTELYTLADENKIAETTATKFMGHSKSMKDVYLHLDKEKVKKMLKDQVYHLEELPPEKKAELEEKIKELKNDFKLLQEHILYGKPMPLKKLAQTIK